MSGPIRSQAEQELIERANRVLGNMAHLSVNYGAPSVIRDLLDALAARDPQSFTCKVKAAGKTDPPQDCDWPNCGCDPYANKVLNAIEEQAPGLFQIQRDNQELRKQLAARDPRLEATDSGRVHTADREAVQGRIAGEAASPDPRQKGDPQLAPQEHDWQPIETAPKNGRDLRSQASLDRELLRRAGEHLGTLAERDRETWERYHGQRGAWQTAKKFYNQFARLSRLSREVLEIANG